MKLHIAAVMAGLALGPLAGASQAAVIININQVGNDVVATGGGSINLFGLNETGQYSNDVGVRGDPAFFGAGTQFDDMVAYYPLSGPDTIGSGTDLVRPTIYTGSDFAVYGNQAVYLSPDYESGDLLSFSETFSGKTIASLGLTAGTYTYTFTPILEAEFRSFAIDPNTVTINISAVPLPASAPLFGAALLGLAGLGYAGKRKAAAAT